MLEWMAFSQGMNAFAQTETARLGATIVVLGATMVSVRLLQSRASSRCVTETEITHQRGNFVLAKNMVLLAALIVVGIIWASKIAGAALSLAAVTGAVLIVTKDFLVNLLGWAMLAISRPYRVGDFIEFDGVSGRVIDTDLLGTTVAETHQGRQITGSTVTLPHSLLLSKPVRNLTATGAYVINLLNVAAMANEDIGALERALLQAGMEVCADWLDEANAHLKQIGSRELVDLPSPNPRVLLQLDQPGRAMLALRYCCRPNDRIKVEQAILRRYLALKPAAPALLHAA